MTKDPIDGMGGAAVGGLVAFLAALALVPLRDVIDNANVALCLVVVVVLCGFFGGRWAATGAAVGAAVCFDFFHTEPYLELRIKSSDDVVTTVLLLVIAVLVGQLTAVARRRRAEARLGHDELERVWRVAELAARGVDDEDVRSAVRVELIGLLGLSDCTFRTGPLPGVPALSRTGSLEGVQLRYRNGGFELPAEGVALPVQVGDRTFGHLVCTPRPGIGTTREERHVAMVLADQLALAMATRPRPNASA